MKKFIPLFFSLIASLASADNNLGVEKSDGLPALITNGCGSGRIGFLVPNKTWLSQCQFEDACNRHDICYGKCLKGGALEGNATCEDENDKAQRKLECDSQFKNDIIKNNPNKSICSMYASAYKLAVTILGKKFFHGIGNSQNIEGTLAKLMAYINKNPNVFDNLELEQAFEILNTNNNYHLIFDQAYLRLTIWEDNKLIFEVVGK